MVEYNNDGTEMVGHNNDGTEMVEYNDGLETVVL